LVNGEGSSYEIKKLMIYNSNTMRVTS
jgi:hypothetical protein